VQTGTAFHLRQAGITVEDVEGYLRSCTLSVADFFINVVLLAQA